MKRKKLVTLLYLSLAMFASFVQPKQRRAFYTANTNEKNHFNKVGWKY